MSLLAIVAGHLWHTQQALKFGPLAISTRSTVVRLSDGSLWVHSPVIPTDELVNALSSIGPVQFVVAPNRGHHLYFMPFIRAFPGAQGFVAPGLADRFTELAGLPVIGTTPQSDWTPDLIGFFIEGLPIINETVWLHVPTGTLILTDLLFCFGPDNSWLARMVARLLGVYNHPGMSRTMKYMVKDRAALRRSVDRILAYDFERIVLSHDQIVEDEAKTKFAKAFEWLRI